MITGYSEIIGFNTEEIESLADIIYRYSELKLKKGDPAYQEYIASGYVISAILQAIANPNKSKDIFQKGADLYRISKNRFYILLEICANNRFYARDNTPNPNDAYSFFLEAYIASSNRDYNHFDKFNEHSFYQFIYHYVPFELYYRSIKNISVIDSVGALDKTLFKEVLTRISERTRFMMKDNHQWRSKLGYNFIPIEVESIAFGVIINRFLRKKNGSFEQLREILNVNELDLLPLFITRDIVNEDYNNEEFE